MLLTFVSVFAQVLDDSVKYDIFQVSLTSDEISKIEKLVKHKFVNEEAELKLKKANKIMKVQKKRVELQNKLKGEKSEARKFELERQLSQLKIEEKNIAAWEKHSFKVLDEEKKLTQRREERLEELKQTLKIVDERVSDYKTQLDADQENKQIQFNYNVTAERKNVIENQIKEIEKRRKEQNERHVSLNLVRESMKAEKAKTHKANKKLIKKIRDYEKKGDVTMVNILKDRLEDNNRHLKEELLDMRERELKTKKNNAMIDMRNAKNRETKMFEIIAKLRHQKAHFLHIQKRPDNCPFTKNQLEKRIKYFTFMEQKAKERLDESGKAWKRYEFIIDVTKKDIRDHLERKAFLLKQFAHEDDAKLTYYKEKIDEIDALNAKGKLSVDDYKKKNKYYMQRKALVEKRLNLIQKRIREFGDVETFEKKMLEKKLRREVRSLTNKIEKMEERMVVIDGKLKFFNKKRLQTKDKFTQKVIARRIIPFVKEHEKLRKIVVYKKNILASKKLLLENVSLGLISHETQIYEKLVEKKEDIEAQIKLLQKQKKGQKGKTTPLQCKQMRCKERTLQGKLERVNKELEQSGLRLRDLRLETNFKDAKDAFTIRARRIDRLSEKKHFFEKDIAINENKLVQELRFRTFANQESFKNRINDLKEKIAYSKEELEELKKLQLRVMKKSLVKAQRLQTIGSMMYEKARDARREIENTKRDLVVKSVKETDEKKHSILISRLEETEQKQGRMVKIEIQCKNVLQWCRKELRKIKIAIRKSIESQKVCEEKGDCPLCRKLSEIMKKDMIAAKSDRVILNDMKKVCKKLVPGKQMNCYYINENC